MKTSQSSLEFLANYGWIIIILIIAGYALFKLNIFGTDNIVAFKVERLDEFYLKDAKIDYDGNITIVISSNYYNYANIKGIEYNIEGYDCHGNIDLDKTLKKESEEIKAYPLKECIISSDTAVINLTLYYTSEYGLSKVSRGKILSQVFLDLEDIYINILSPLNSTYYSNLVSIEAESNGKNMVYYINGNEHNYTSESLFEFFEGENEIIFLSEKNGKKIEKKIIFTVDTSVNITSCMSISSPGRYSLRNNISNSSTCIIINSSNIELDCKGYSINYSNTSIGYGIKADLGYSNITIKNCNILQTSALSNGYGIYLGRSSTGTNTHSHLIKNNTIKTLGVSSYAINTYRVINSIFKGNNLFTYGISGYGIYFRITYSNEFLNNNFYINQSISVSPYISATKSEYNNSFIGNTEKGREIIYIFGKNNETISEIRNVSTIIIAGSSNVTFSGIGTVHEGIRIILSSNINVIDSVLLSDKRSASPFSVYGNSYNNSLMNSILNSSGISAYGVYSDTAPSGTLIYNNTIITSGASSYGMYLRSPLSKAEYNFVNTTGASSYGINANGNNQQIIGNEIYTYGATGYALYFYACSGAKFISNHAVTYAASVPSLYLYNGNEGFFYNNTIETYSSLSYGIYIRTSANSSFLNNSIFTNQSRAVFFYNTNARQHYNHTFYGNSEKGREIIYIFGRENEEISNISNASGIIIASSNNITISNASVLNEGIAVFLSNNSRIISSNINVAERDSYAFSANYKSLNNSIQDSIISTNGINGHGIYSDSSSNFTIAKNNNITTNASSSHGIYFAGHFSVSSGNNITLFQTSSYGFYSTGTNNSIINSIILTYSSSSYGINSISNYSEIYNNNITTHGSSSYGIYFSAAGAMPLISDNKVYTSGTNAYGAYILGPNAKLLGNTIITSGTTSYALYSRAINLTAVSNNFNTKNTAVYTIYFNLAQNNMLYNNIINTSRTGSGAYYTGTLYYQIWNSSKELMPNIAGGSYKGGNYWANLAGTGYSQTCDDDDYDGICDFSYNAYSSNMDYLPIK